MFFVNNHVKSCNLHQKFDHKTSFANNFVVTIVLAVAFGCKIQQVDDD